MNLTPHRTDPIRSTPHDATLARSMPLPLRASVRSALKVSVVIPTLREANNLAHVLGRIASALKESYYEVLIIDDASDDGTVELCKQLSCSIPVSCFVRQTPTHGLSGALLEGFGRATGEILIAMDGDLQHPPESLPELIRPLIDGTADLAIGSRYVLGARLQPGWPTFRKLISSCGRLAVKPICSTVHDPMSGFFAIHRADYDRIQKGFRPIGFKFLLELLCAEVRLRVTEIPIQFGARRAGYSKLRARPLAQFVRQVIRCYFSRCGSALHARLSRRANIANRANQGRVAGRSGPIRGGDEVRLSNA